MNNNHRPRAYILAGVVSFGLALTACSGRTNPDAAQLQSSAAEPAVLTLADLPGGFDGPHIVETTATTVTIRFDTSVPTVCNAPYGETTDYGQVATIPMSGATPDHILTFNNLKPGTTYHYQITATDNEGNVYIGGGFTFATADAEDVAMGASDDKVVDSAMPDPNLLAMENGAVVIDVSSNYGNAMNGGMWGANSAIDGNGSTEWATAGDGENAYIVIQLAEDSHIHTLEAHTRRMMNDTAQIFSFTVTDDAGRVYGPFELPDASEPHSFEVDITTTTLRFDAIETSGGNTGFVELAAYGTPVRGE